MTDHLSDVILNALADGELLGDQAASTSRHLAECSVCTANALKLSLLKSATAKAGQRYAPSPQLAERLSSLPFRQSPKSRTQNRRDEQVASSRPVWGSLGWAAATLLLVVAVCVILVHRATLLQQSSSAEQVAHVTEVLDMHIATLADSQPLQVLSTDRHTVKPWFQGKIPFSFNLPPSLPSDTTLDGAKLTYLDNQPVAQLIYSIGKHRVSVFLRRRSSKQQANPWRAEHSGFHLMGFRTDDLDVVAISDADPARFSELVSAIQHAETEDPQKSK
jgi:anti-sigma factor RsiW